MCAKVNYPSRECAIYAAWEQGKRREVELNPYKCNACQYWHLTRRETDWTFETQVFKGWMTVEEKLNNGYRRHQRIPVKTKR